MAAYAIYLGCSADLMFIAGPGLTWVNMTTSIRILLSHHRKHKQTVNKQHINAYARDIWTDNNYIM